MNAILENQCLNCSTNQHCCSKVSGLMLSRTEYSTHFKSHHRELTVRTSQRVVIVSSKNGGPCPHWGADGCRIYQERPIDCRVFPYTLTHIIEKGKEVKIVFHDRSDCPQKKGLFPLAPEAGIIALLTEFGRKMYGVETTIMVQHENGIVSRFFNRIDSLSAPERDAPEATARCCISQAQVAHSHEIGSIHVAHHRRKKCPVAFVPWRMA